MTKNKHIAILSASLLIGSGPLAASESSQEIKEISLDIPKKLDEIDSMMNRALESFRIPGMAVGIVMNGQVIFTKGYGVRKFSELTPVTENTLFAIGSCSKAFTTFALGQLVDEGAIGWEDPVIKYIPEFRLHDIHATHHLTIRDLVTHRSGLPRHDMVWYNSKFPRCEILNRLQHLEPTCDLREKFQYNNLMYAVAGLVIERVSGQTWEDFVGSHIFSPLGMNRSNFLVDESQQSNDFASPHTEKNKQIELISFRPLSNIGPAGSINSSVENMTRWIQLQLSQGEMNGKRLIHSETLKEMHIVHMPVHSPFFEDMFGYGLGWFTGLHKGHYVVTHGGGIDGFISQVLLLPEEKIGVVILTNSDSHFLFPLSATLGIADMLLGKENDQWLSKVEEKEKQMKELMEAKDTGEVVAEAISACSFEQYIGDFEHPGYGIIRIFLDQDKLCASFNDLSYVLTNKCYDHFTGASKLIMDHKFSCSFIRNATGEISEFHIGLELALTPIVFKRKAADELLAADYLKKFTGTFECSVFSVEVALKKGRLIATVLGQPPYEMKPEKPNLFSLKESPNCSLQFIPAPEGTISSLQLVQAGQTFTLKAKAIK